jgi:hypothetical protein
MSVNGPIATNSSFGPDVSFWGEAEVGGRQRSLPRSKLDPYLPFGDQSCCVAHGCVRHVDLGALELIESQ